MINPSKVGGNRQIRLKHSAKRETLRVRERARLMVAHRRQRSGAEDRAVGDDEQRGADDAWTHTPSTRGTSFEGNEFPRRHTSSCRMNFSLKSFAFLFQPDSAPLTEITEIGHQGENLWILFLKR